MNVHYFGLLVSILHGSTLLYYTEWSGVDCRIGMKCEVSSILFMIYLPTEKIALFAKLFNTI